MRTGGHRPTHLLLLVLVALASQAGGQQLEDVFVLDLRRRPDLSQHHPPAEGATGTRVQQAAAGQQRRSLPTARARSDCAWLETPRLGGPPVAKSPRASQHKLTSLPSGKLAPPGRSEAGLPGRARLGRHTAHRHTRAGVRRGGDAPSCRSPASGGGPEEVTLSDPLAISSTVALNCATCGVQPSGTRVRKARWGGWDRRQSQNVLHAVLLWRASEPVARHHQPPECARNQPADPSGSP